MATKKLSKARATKQPSTPAKARTASEPSAQFKFKAPDDPDVLVPMHRLPFWLRGSGIALPTCSNYMAGCDMGTAAAQAYLKALRATPGAGCGHLQGFVISMLEQGWDASNSPEANHRGVLVGFFSVLDKWLFDAAHVLGQRLDTVSEEALEQRMATAATKTDAESNAELRVLIKANKVGVKA